MKNYSIVIFTFCFLVSSGMLTHTDDVEKFIDKFRRYYRLFPQEKIYQQYSRDIGFPGDTVRFKSYLVKVDDFLPSEISGIIYTDLIDEYGQITETVKSKVKSGFGHGELIIPEIAREGKYTIRSYTNWMRNFNDSLFHYHPFIVLPDENILTGFSTMERNSIQLDFFPEGGKLIDQVTSKIVIKASGQFNLPVRVNGQVFDQDGLLVASINTSDNGIGAFILTPQSGKKYQAVVSDREVQQMIFPIPEPSASGAILSIRKQTKDLIRVLVSASEDYKKMGRTVHLIVQAKGNIYFTSTVAFDHREMSLIDIPARDLPEGIIQLELLNDEGKHESERLVFNNNSFSPEVTIILNDTLFSTREKVVAEIKIPEMNQSTVLNNFSVIAAPRDYFIPSGPNLKTSLWFDEPISDQEIAVLGIENENPISKKEFDFLLITKSSTRYRWENVLGHNRDKPSLYPEKGLTMMGKITSPEVEIKGGPYLVNFLFYPEFDPYSVTTDSSGNFTVPVFPFSGTQHALYQVIIDRAIQPQARIVLDKQMPAALVNFPFRLNDNIRQFKNTELNIRNARASYQYYTRKQHGLRQDVNQNNLRSFAEPDLTVDLNQYVELGSTEEVFREIVPLVFVKDSENGKFLKVFSKEYAQSFEGEALCFINRTPVPSSGDLLNLDPGDISEVHIYYKEDKLTKLGAFGVNGVVSVSTGSDTQLPPGQLQGNGPYVEFEGIYRDEKRSDLPSMVSDDAKIPDLRRVLCWETALQKNEEGNIMVSFNTSDIPDDYILKVEGITQTGTPISQSIGFAVSDRKE